MRSLVNFSTNIFACSEELILYTCTNQKRDQLLFAHNFTVDPKCHYNLYINNTPCFVCRPRAGRVNHTRNLKATNNKCDAIYFYRPFIDRVNDYSYSFERLVTIHSHIHQMVKTSNDLRRCGNFCSLTSSRVL